MQHVRHVRVIVRYPAKSMAGESMQSAFVGWHAIPDTAKQHPAFMKGVVRLNEKNAGAYGTVVRREGGNVADTADFLRGGNVLCDCYGHGSSSRVKD
jgi:hypothetical protein